MELVYLWVEDYKNIKKQGFNFSPRFECTYDEDTTTLIVTKKENYLNIFPKNINVTAIVGENGSGKSSIIKIILLLIFLKKYELKIINNETIAENIKDAISHLVVLGNLEKKDIYLIIYQNNEIKKISLLQSMEQISKKIEPISTFEWEIAKSDISIKYQDSKIDESNNIDFFSIHFNYMLDTLYDGTQDSWIKQLYHKNDRYDTPILLEPSKSSGSEQIINLNNIEYINNQNFLRFYSQATTNESIDFFKPDKITITLARDFIPNLSFEDKGLQLLTIKRFYTYYHKILSNDDNSITEDSIQKFIEYIKNLYNDNEYKKINLLYLSFKVLSLNKSLFNETNYQLIKENITSLFDDTSNNGSYTNIEAILNSLILEDAPDYEVRKIKICIAFNENIDKMVPILRDNSIQDLETGITKNIDDVKDILQFIPSWMSVVWLEDKKTFNSLSGGEKTIFTFLLNLMYQIQNINDKNEYNTINVFLDEVELGFHPQWQKKFLTYILNALKSVNDNEKIINITFMTHSPFILSDLPKENVIFLDKINEETKEKYPNLNIDGLENSNCINVSKEINLNPFGANIHTLLSHGFFMQDGLMGEFAKGKINEVITGLQADNIDSFSQREMKAIIDAIGEPFLQTKLKQMYDKKFPQTKDEQIQVLQNQIDKLNQE